jgi:hypothetical protein
VGPFALAVYATPDAPVSPGNGEDAAPPPELKTTAAKRKAKAKPTTESEPTVEVAYTPSPESGGVGRRLPPRDPLNDMGEPEEEGPDPFDPANLRIDPISIEGLGDRVLTEGQVSVRKPHKREFFKLHPDPDFREQMAVIILKEEMNATYLVEPRLAQGLMREISFVTLAACINTGGNVFLWPIPAPTDGRRQNSWHQTAREASKLALEGKWVRMIPDMEGGCYAVYVGVNDLATVEWPKGKTFRDLLRLGFGEEGVIRNKDHSLLKRLRGQRV